MISTYAGIIAFFELLFCSKTIAYLDVKIIDMGSYLDLKIPNCKILTFPCMNEVFVKEKLVNKQKTDVPKSKGAIRSRILSLLDVKEMKPGISTICVITFHSETYILGSVA